MPFQALLLGLVLGARHALEPDHLAAVTTFVTDDGRRGSAAAARTGAAWGLGHALAIVIVGGIVVLLGLRVPARLAVGLEVCVAVMLVGLGARALLRARSAPQEPIAAAPPSRGLRRSTLVGFVHGASGTAAITVLCASTLPNRSTAIAFLVLFALAALVSMATLSALMAAPLSTLARRGEHLLRFMRVSGGVLALAAAALVVVRLP